ncbi:MAG: hypothetical protein Q7S62_02585 [bacterium]|nr:hypothetical protein [bacterium]
MLLVDFGESTCKFALVKEYEKSLEVQEWGIEDIRSLEYAAEHILERMKGVHGDMEPVFVSLPATLWRSRVLYEGIERKNAALRIDSAEKETILEGLFARTRSSLKEQVQDSSGILAEDVSIQKLQILKYTIDGYHVQDILGFPGTHLDVQIMAVFALVKHLPIVDNIIQRFSSISSPRIVHLAEALEGFSQTRPQDAIYIDMGDAFTRIIATQQKRVAFVDEVSRGGRDFTLYLQETLSLGENTAKDFKERYASGDFSFPLREAVKEGFLAIAEDLARLVCKSLRSTRVSLPSSIFLFGEASKLPEIEKAFLGNIFEGLPFHEKPRISFLLPKDLWTLEFPGKTNPVFTPLFFLPYAP